MAFSIFRTFKARFTKEERRCIEIACDCTHGKSDFYRQIGIDVREEIRRAIMIIKMSYKLD